MFEHPSSVLVVVAHPDDEVLGCGGTMYRLAQMGIPVRTCILCSAAEARGARPALETLHRHTREAQAVLGIQEGFAGPFPNLQLNTISQLALVQYIENAIISSRSDTIFTQHPGDLNDDHLQTSRACQAAVRLAQRRTGLPNLKGFFYMEVPSATDWALAPEPRFHADTFFEIGTEGVERKLSALACYEGVMRPYPHPRSEEVIRGLAACRGGECGLLYAEAFQAALRVHALAVGDA